MLTKKQFDILAALTEKDAPMTLEELAASAGCGVPEAEDILSGLVDKKLLEGRALTAQGYEALEPYRVKRAVFMAAGFGSRLMPVTEKTPKPLVTVRGRRIIDTMLDALLAAGITEIYIVRGYLAAQFDALREKYPTVSFIENPEYDQANNISSALRAREHLSGAYILDADLFLKNPRLISRYQYSSNYLGVPVERTDDWCLFVRDGRIDRVALGGENCHAWVGISYWTERDGARLAEDISRVYGQPGGRAKYWDLVPLECCKETYSIGVRECSAEDIIEIDTLDELKKLDGSYGP